jgi:predicted transcriptional regulator
MRKNNFKYTYVYENGKEATRDEVVKHILEFCGKGKHPLADIAKGIGMNYSSVNAAVRWSYRNGVMHSTRIGRKYLFGAGYLQDNACLLADLLHPKEKILKQFKVKGVIKRKAEDTPVKTTISKGAGVTYGQHVLNTVYE